MLGVPVISGCLKLFEATGTGDKGADNLPGSDICRDNGDFVCLAASLCSKKRTQEKNDINIKGLSWEELICLIIF